MIDERHLDDLLVEAGEELDRLAGDCEPLRTERVRGSTPRRNRRLVPFVAVGTVAAGVAALAFVVVDDGDPVGIGSAPLTRVDEDELTSLANVDPTSTTAPTPVTEADPIATSPYLMLDAVPAGFGPPTSVSTSYGKDFEPPAHLLGWRDPGVVGPARVPVVVSSQWTEALPESRDIDSGTVTGWIANISGVTVGSFHMDGMSATVRVESSSIPDADIVALMSGLPPSLEVEWGGGNGPPAASSRSPARPTMHTSTARQSRPRMVISSRSER